MPTPRLSVVIPCRLSGTPGVEMRAALLKLTLVALDQQTVPREDYEIVVVDDASDIDLADLVGEVAADQLGVRPRVVRNTGPAHGQTVAYNIGIHEARAPVVLLATDDSLLAPGALAAHIDGHASLGVDTYLCGIERQYMYGVLFRDITTGRLHPRGDLAVRAFGSLVGFADIQAAAEQFGFTEWTVTPDDVRYRFNDLFRIAALTPGFRDMYEELASDREDLRWLCVRMGNHSAPRDALLRIGGVEETVPGTNSDQDLGLKLAAAGVGIALEPRATSILVEHRRNLRAFADGSGLRRLAERWPRPEVSRLGEYFARGYDRRIDEYRRALIGPAKKKGEERGAA
jgi:glycosyltransferase involved in cell wall biosynthesis